LIERPKPELEQFAVDARRTPKQILRAHLPDQRAQFCFDLRSPFPSMRFPTPIAAKTGPMPTHQRFGLNNHENRKDRREPAIELDEEPAVVVREASPKTTARPCGRSKPWEINSESSYSTPEA
jgi:hypothetical protein